MSGRVSCPVCGIVGVLGDERQFPRLAVPLGGDPLHGCVQCKARLLAVPRAWRVELRALTDEGNELLEVFLPGNEPAEGVPPMLSEDGRKVLRRSPYSLSAMEVADALRDGFAER